MRRAILLFLYFFGHGRAEKFAAILMDCFDYLINLCILRLDCSVAGFLSALNLPQILSAAKQSGQKMHGFYLADFIIFL